ncbi:MAG: mechanosensitive ion channel [Sulfuriflexus sp.]|nr:mechanosensitive ion channel [Sulfuriflexus sp.]
MPGISRAFSLVFLVLMISVVMPAYAQDETQDPMEGVITELTTIERDLDAGRLDVDTLVKDNKKLTDMKIRATECVATYEKRITDKQTSLASLGDEKKDEPIEVRKQRKQLQEEIDSDSSSLATCKAILLRLDNTINKVETQRQQRLQEQLLPRGPNILEIIDLNMKQPAEWLTSPWEFNKDRSWLRQAPDEDLSLLIAVIIISITIGIFIRLQFSKWVKRQYWSDGLGGRFSESVLISFCHDAPYLLGSVSTAICLHYLTIGIQPHPIVTTLGYGLAFLFVSRFVIRFTLAPSTPGRLFLDINLDTARAFARRLYVLTVIVFFGYLSVDTLISASLPDYAIRLVNSVIYILFAINMIWILWLFRELGGIVRHGWFRYGLSLVLIVAVITDLIGYFNLAGWLFRSVFGTLLAIGVVQITGRLISEVLEGLEYGKTPWQRSLRRLIGLTTEGHITGFFWIRLLVILGLWGLLALLLIFIWDVSASVIEEIRLVFTNGFTIGSLKVVPARIMLALVSLGFLVALSAWVQGQLKKHWLNNMPMEQGTQQALVTVTGYVGVTIAILVSLGIAGIEFANLAIIAGALSVGIGFGLQNIVNNFVSGLVLLFERPIKAGDWIVVGATEGYVKRIRIRATQIQTFDRADVIVPNSELVSGQVTNWMLHDTRGRARIPVGVAYGTDTAKVKKILLELAEQHEEIITDVISLVPAVLFQRFGDSALEFELRVHIHNVDNRLHVISDLNYAIDQAFRENGISIPFPQRDVHLRDMPGPAGES